MDWTSRLMDAIGYLEDSLEGEVNYEKAAGMANCSLFHFCRMFEVVFGSSPAEYVRRRRLSRSALDLAASGQKVIDIALRYGWDTPESFTKAFKRCFGITPTEARQSGTVLETWPPIRLAITLRGDKSMKYRIVEKGPINFTGIAVRTTSSENENLKTIPQFWLEKGNDGTVEALGKEASPFGLVGVCYDYKVSDNTFAYAIAIEKPTKASVSLPAGCEEIHVPPATYAVFESHGPMPDAIQQVWKEVYSEWFPSSEYEHAGTPDFEVYPQQENGCDSDLSADFYSEVWIPIHKK